MPVIILEISSANGSSLSRGHYIYVRHYNRERIYTNRNHRLKCSLSLRAFAVLMFLWLFHVYLLFSQSIAVNATVLLTSHTRKNLIVIAVSTCVCYGTALKFTPGAILVWVVTIESQVLGRVLGRYIQRGVTFKGALLFSVYYSYRKMLVLVTHSIVSV